MSVTEQILGLAQKLALAREGFFDKKGPGAGDRDTSQFMAALRAKTLEATGVDYSEKRISGDNKLAVDFYVESEATVIEVALSLRNPNCEFERDLLKALMARDEGFQVERLVFLSKPGGVQRLGQPSAQAIIQWAARNHDLAVEVVDFETTERPPNTALPTERSPALRASASR